MILFKPEHIAMIVGGSKTQTRRIWTKRRAKPGAIHKAKTAMLSKEYFALLTIKRVWKEQVGEISDEDAVKEGYKDKEDYLRIFYKINEKKLKKIKHWKCLEVFVVEFECLAAVWRGKKYYK